MTTLTDYMFISSRGETDKTQKDWQQVYEVHWPSLPMRCSDIDDFDTVDINMVQEHFQNTLHPIENLEHIHFAIDKDHNHYINNKYILSITKDNHTLNLYFLLDLKGTYYLDNFMGYYLPFDNVEYLNTLWWIYVVCHTTRVLKEDMPTLSEKLKIWLSVKDMVGIPDSWNDIKISCIKHSESNIYL